MVYIENIKLKTDHRNLLKDLTIDFKDITLLVGDQGSGKSTILSLLQTADENIGEFGLTKYTMMNGINSYYFDTESMNPRVRNMDDFTTPSGMNKGIGVGGFLSSKFKSHGEVMELFTVGMLKKAKKSVLLLDEPESGLSLKNQYNLIEAIETASKANAQLVIATHCMPLIEHFTEVYDMENKTWIDSKSYLDKFRK